jgi:glucose-6-phosphate dehydrogenase assembly protein OpcA
VEAAVTSLESFTSGRPLAVDVGRIERELASLWKSASEPGSGEDIPAVTHACLLNLVVLCRSIGEATRHSATIAEVARARPSRVLVAVVDEEDGGDRLEASISAHCSISPGSKDKQVCCEQITITASAGAASRLPGALRPLLLTDLPVALWSPEDPDLGSDLTAALVEAADLLLVDSRRFGNEREQVRVLASLRAFVTDLGWIRLRGWREVTAALFDNEFCDDYTALIDAIRVEHAGDRTTEALWLGAWAASRLGWTLERTRSGLVIEISPEKDADAGVTSLSLRAGEARFDIERAGAEHLKVSMALPGCSPRPHTARVMSRDDATLLCRGLEQGPDPLFMATLDLAARTLERS